MRCQYVLWSRRKHALKPCGKPAKASPYGFLCTEHLAFVKDSTKGPFTRSRKHHPFGFNWLTKARAAYGLKSRYCLELPSDAGKPTGLLSPAQKADIEAWNTRRLAQIHADIKVLYDRWDRTYDWRY